MTSSSYATYTTLGVMPCGKIISTEGEDIVEYYILGWVRGYITARNYENNIIINNVDSDSIKYAALKFCRDNPLKDLDDAAINIYSSIEKK